MHRAEDRPADVREAGGASEESLEDSMSVLRNLLLSPEQRQIADLRRRIEEDEAFAEDVSRVIAEALVRRDAEDEALGQVMMPLVLDAMRRAAKQQPGALAEVMMPVIGPAVRRAVAAAFRGLVESIGRTIERGLSPRAIKWRIEAWRTRRPYHEVVLAHALVFRVERVLWTHRETGLLLGEAAIPGAAGEDGALIAGVLTATADLAHDAVGATSGEGVAEAQVGDLTLLTDEGPRSMLTGVVRGRPPERFRDDLGEIHEALRYRFFEQVEDFDGDTAPFASARDLLELCLEEELS